ncbi:MAG: alanine racemase [Rickettsiaceae bacterium]|nr:alanine racemase [Rickettsiaceae bacterium]
MRSYSVLEIDLDIIRQNYIKLRELALCEVAATLKADSYGLGATQIGKALAQEGCKTFFVFDVKEALSLKESQPEAKIFFYNGFCNGEEEVIVRNKISPVINLIEQLESLNLFCKSNNIYHSVILHVETGLNRLALTLDDVKKIAANPEIYSNLKIEYIMSHLASADEPENQFNKVQLGKFFDIIKLLPKSKYSIANTAGTLLGKEYHLDLVRPGAGIYGVNPRIDMSLFRNPVKLFSPLIQIKLVKKGEYLGYNQTYQAKEDMWVGTLPLGYADGISRILSNKGYCYIKNNKAPIIGRISMDLINIDLTNIPHYDRFLGQEVFMICDQQTPDDLAIFKNTIGYEIITSLGKRYERKYTNQ